MTNTCTYIYRKPITLSQTMYAFGTKTSEPKPTIIFNKRLKIRFSNCCLLVPDHKSFRQGKCILSEIRWFLTNFLCKVCIKKKNYLKSFDFLQLDQKRHLTLMWRCCYSLSADVCRFGHPTLIGRSTITLNIRWFPHCLSTISKLNRCLFINI